MRNQREAGIIATALQGNAVAKAKAYEADTEYLFGVIDDLEAKLRAVQADPERLSKLEVAAKIDPDHLQRLLALEKAVVSVGYCGMPTAG